MKYGVKEIIEMSKKGIHDSVVDAIVQFHWEIDVEDVLELQKIRNDESVISLLKAMHNDNNDGKNGNDNGGNKSGNKKGTGKKSKYNWIKDFDEGEYQKKAIEMGLALMEGNKFVKVPAKNREKVYRACGFIE